MKETVIGTIQEVKSLIYMLEYLKANHFERSTKIGDLEHREIELAIEKMFGEDSRVKKSTIYRICSFRDLPKRISHKSLNIFTRWCFSGDTNYNNFTELVEDLHSRMDQIDLISDTEAESILDRLHKKKALAVPTMKTLTADLGEFQVSYKLDEGYIKKIVDTVSIVTGDIVSKRIKENPREFGIYPTKKIYNRVILKEERRQRNIDSIVAKAIEFARGKEASENRVDPDWIVEFFNIAQDCSYENMQYLWAKLLANEIKEPSSISRRTLSIIKLLVHQEAKVFTKLCNCIWTFKGIGEFKEKVLIKDMYSNRKQDEKAWNFDSLFIPHLSAIGLVEETYLDMRHGKTYELDFFGKTHTIKASKSTAQLEMVALTLAGKEVFNILQPTPNNKYYKFLIEYFNTENLITS